MISTTEFYKTIPHNIIGKLIEYKFKYSASPHFELWNANNLSECFQWIITPEGFDFWDKHYENKTFPIWSDKENRFINI